MPARPSRNDRQGTSFECEWALDDKKRTVGGVEQKKDVANLDRILRYDKILIILWSGGGLFLSWNFKLMLVWLCNKHAV
jgi:hypothetical protein